MNASIISNIEWFKDPALARSAQIAALAQAPEGKKLTETFKAAEKAADKDLATRLASLGKLAAAAASLARQFPKDKPLAGFVADLSAAIEEESEAIGELANPALLTTAMAALLRQLPTATVPWHAWITIAPQLAVLLTRKKRAKNAASGPMLAYLGESAARFLAAEVLFEDGVCTFVIEAQISGLARRIKAAIKQQTGLSLPLRVRDAAGALDADLEIAPVAEPAETFKAHLAALLPTLQAATTRQPELAQAATHKVREAGALAGQRRFVEAGVLLDQAEALLLAPVQAAKFDEAGFRRQWSAAIARWQLAIDTVNAQIGALQQALAVHEDQELREIAEFGLSGVTGNFRTPLMAVMVEIGAAHGEGLRKSATRAARLAQEFARYLASETRVEAVDQNPFGIPVSLRATLVPALTEIGQLLTPLG